MVNLKGYDDDVLLDLVCRKEDQNAFAVIYDRYKDRVYSYILKHVKSPEISEEILADIFLKLWQGRILADQIKGGLSAFLHKVAYYKAMDFLRTTARHKRLQNMYLSYYLPGDNAESPESLAIYEEERQLLLSSINKLPPRQKEVYLLSRDKGLSHEQIAKKLNLSGNTVNNHLKAALKNITMNLYSVTKPSLNTIMLFLACSSSFF